MAGAAGPSEVRRADEVAGGAPLAPPPAPAPAATRLRKQYGLEAARVILGHKSAAVAEVYAEIDQAKARHIMGEVG